MIGGNGNCLLARRGDEGEGDTGAREAAVSAGADADGAPRSTTCRLKAALTRASRATGRPFPAARAAAVRHNKPLPPHTLSTSQRNLPKMKHLEITLNLDEFACITFKCKLNYSLSLSLFR